jgi:hypothetical protein
MTHPLLHHPYPGLFRARRARSLRASSWDRTGANQDYISIQPGETVVLMEHEGPGCLTHLYCAMVLPDLRDYRNAILRCYWDGADQPSVEVPLGDFFGLAHARVREFSSAMVAVNAGFGSSHGLNVYFPMPFDTGARVTLENRGTSVLGGALGAFWYHIEYETYDDPLPEGIDRFHASYRQERPTTAIGDEPNITLHAAQNLDGKENYVALDTLKRLRPKMPRAPAPEQMQLIARQIGEETLLARTGGAPSLAVGMAQVFDFEQHAAIIVIILIIVKIAEP